MIIEMIVEQVAPALDVDPTELVIGILHEDSSYGTSVAGHQNRFAEEAGLNVVTTLAYPANIVDMSLARPRPQGARGRCRSSDLLPERLGALPASAP